MPSPKSTHSVVFGQKSWTLKSSTVELALTQTGGHLAPVVFDRKKRKLQPYSVAPWHKEKSPSIQPPILRILRGDFLCMPFGGWGQVVKGKTLQLHGESANAPWKLEKNISEDGDHVLHVSQKQKDLGGRIDKVLLLRDGHQAVYNQHIISGINGPMNLGHHATLKFPEMPGSGLISTSAFKFGEVFPKGLEKPENAGYTSLKAGGTFSSLGKVPLATGEFTDLSRYPARKGFEDLVMMASDPDLPFAWSAASFPQEQYVWFALKDPRILRQTIFWISNGGRHFAPWNGRHFAVMGMEDVTSYYGETIKECSSPNSFSKRGFPTHITLSAKAPLKINYIMGCVPTPKGFGKVSSITADGKKITLHSGKLRVSTPLDIEFLFS
ncbi:MAG: hypothetical protein SGI98_00170 [Verrucomicrobiota bacterium]|nr:hypothetical protein [Verrucomicrobiota bacterium]